MRFYTIKLCGLTRNLPIVKIGPRISIASFNMIGDAAMVRALAPELLKRIKQYSFDIFVGPEMKAVPLVSQMAQVSGTPNYVIVRNKIMDYMIDPVIIDTRRTMVLNGPDKRLLRARRAAIVTDIVYTGKTVNATIELLKTINCTVVCVVAALKQGQLQEKIKVPLIFLGTLPIIRE